MRLILDYSVNTAYTMFSIKLLYNNLTTLCLNGTLPGVDFMDVTMSTCQSNPDRL